MRNIAIGTHCVNYSAKKRKRDQGIALSTLLYNKPDEVQVCSFNFEDDVIELPFDFPISKKLKRDSKELITDRRLPYVKDIINLTYEIGCDVFGCINSDVLLTKEFFDLFEQEADVYLFSRTDISEVSVSGFNDKKFRVVWGDHPGCDGFFFKKEWWSDNRDKFEDSLIWGEAAWDDYYVKLINHLTKNIITKRAVYHVYHDTVWSDKSVGSKHNIKYLNRLKEEF